MLGGEELVPEMPGLLRRVLRDVGGVDGGGLGGLAGLDGVADHDGELVFCPDDGVPFGLGEARLLARLLLFLLSGGLFFLRGARGSVVRASRREEEDARAENEEL